MREYETVIIGAGVTGVALARELAGRGARRLAVIDKERRVAHHASGRNSGVVHAGYNPKPGTLKARLCVEGNRLLKDFCRARDVPLVDGGILIVATDEQERPRLEELMRRGEESGAPGMRLLENDQIAAIEPNVVGTAAVHAPSGASVDARAYVEALAADARDRGVEILLGREAVEVDRRDGLYHARTGDESIACRRLINCAGLQADRIAHALGAGSDLGIIPVRGEYKLIRPERRDLVRSMVYPVPDLEFPFLGVHWTKTASGDIKVGPNAVVALGREAYSWRESSIRGTLSLAADPRAWRCLTQPRFARLVVDQVWGSLSSRRFLAGARALVPDVGADDLRPGPAGIRAQLVDRAGRLVEDLTVEHDGDGATHVLNVVSPGLTCSLAFAAWLADQLG